MDKAQWNEWLVYLLNRPLAYGLLELSRRLGDVVYLPRIGHVISDAEIALDVLMDTEHFDSHSPGSLGFLVTQALGPYALLNMDGPEHKDLKRRLQEVFSSKYIKALIGSATDDIVNEFRVNLLAGRVVDLVELMKDFSSRMACELIGVRVDPHNEREAYADMFALATEFTALAGLGKPRLSASDLKNATRIVERLSARIRESYEDKDIRDESLTLFLAGHETTANALTWTFYLLSQNPEAERRFHAELDEVLGDREVKPEDFGKLKFTEQVLAKSMRLFPPAWTVGRLATEDHEFGGFRIPAKSLILASQFVMHRDPRFWEKIEGTNDSCFQFADLTS